MEGTLRTPAHKSESASWRSLSSSASSRYSSRAPVRPQGAPSLPTPDLRATRTPWLPTLLPSRSLASQPSPTEHSPLGTDKSGTHSAGLHGHLAARPRAAASRAARQRSHRQTGRRRHARRRQTPHRIARPRRRSQHHSHRLPRSPTRVASRGDPSGPPWSECDKMLGKGLRGRRCGYARSAADAARPQAHKRIM